MNVTILGAGKSGLAAADLAQQNGETVFVSDAMPHEKSADAISFLGGRQIASEFGGHTDKAVKADLVIVSPGVPPNNPVRLEALRLGIEVIGELEYASRFITNQIVAITGTNGKTTTTALTAHILNQAGKTAVVAGNIGTPLSSLVKSLHPSTIVVAECSSYQLDTTTTFRPYISMLLNITPDHLTYHGTFTQYVNAKWKILQHQQANDVVVLNADDAHTANAVSVARGMVSFFSLLSEVDGAFVRGNEIILRDQQHNEEILMPLRRLGLPGAHNAANSMAAALAARAFEVRNENIRDSLASFNGVEHRLEHVRLHRGIRFVNDSKATNVNAAWFALSSYDHPIVWIAGGRGDNNDYSTLDDLVAENVKAIVCIGEDADAIFNHWCTTKRCIKVAGMEDAVHAAAELSVAEDVVLFSPACKSFDMFDNFEERGRAFKAFVNGL